MDTVSTRQYRNVRFAYLIILGEEFGEFLMPPLRCFFLGDIDDCWSSSTATKASAISEWLIRQQRKKQKKQKKEIGHLRQQHGTIWGQWIQRDYMATETQIGNRGWVNRMAWTGQLYQCAVANSPVFAPWHRLAWYLHDCVWRCKHATVPSSTIMPMANV